MLGTRHWVYPWSCLLFVDFNGFDSIELYPHGPLFGPSIMSGLDGAPCWRTSGHYRVQRLCQSYVIPFDILMTEYRFSAAHRSPARLAHTSVTSQTCSPRSALCQMHIPVRTNVGMAPMRCPDQPSHKGWWIPSRSVLHL